MKINENFKNIADGATAFCVFGGPSATNYNKSELKKLLRNNFSICVNKGIEYYPESAMWLTADNKFRQYFEDYKFVLLDPKCLQRRHQQHLQEDDKILFQPKSHYVKNYEGVKVVFGQEGSNRFDIGQIPIKLIEEYSQEYKNLYYCKEYKNPYRNPNWMPALSLEWDQCLEKYGSDMQSVHAGGNIASNVFQLLYYMGFKKIIVIGYCDKGKSLGYNKEWTIDHQSELDAWKVHNKVWGENLRFLDGGEHFEEITGVKHKADLSELNNPEQRREILRKIKKKFSSDEHCDYEGYWNKLSNFVDTIDEDSLDDAWEVMNYWDLGPGTESFKTAEQAKSIENVLIVHESVLQEKKTLYDAVKLKRLYMQDFFEEMVMPETDAIIEVGAGWGRNVFSLYSKFKNTGADFISAEVSDSGQSVCSKLASKFNASVEAAYFNYYDWKPFVSLLKDRGYKNLCILTNHSIEQIPFLEKEMFEDFLSLDTESLKFLHIEPVGFQIEGGNKSFTGNPLYNKNLVEILKELKKKNKIKNLVLKPDYVSFTGWKNCGSLIRWEKN